ncbi:beta-galactosidase [Clostridium carnis]
MNTFEIKEDFYLNNKKFKIISGALHYFRVVPEYWRDRLEKLKALGFNTVETYIPWNYHEKKKGEFNFSNDRDFVKFIKIAEDLGLYVILRPTPYICAEWDFGGLPSWLLKDSNIRIRSNDPKFLEAVDNYFAKLFKYITPLQITNGGPIIMMQVENEYGSFGSTKSYIKNIKNLMIKHGVTVPLFTSDGGWNEALEAGTLIEENLLPTANFGSKTEEQFGALLNFMKKNNIKAPLMCMEFWIGWFNNWGGEFKRRDASDAAMELDKILKLGHVNTYMFHGGTNFGFFNGCSYHNGIDPQTTSYDYDALLTEWGEITPKYNAFKEVVSKYTTAPKFDFTNKINFIDIGEVKLSNKVSLFNTLHTLSSPKIFENTMPMEKIDQGYGYILYRTNVGKKRFLENFKLIGMDDRAQIFINEKLIATKYKEDYIGENIEVDLPNEDNNIIDVLVENLGRVNYGSSLLSPRQSKGIKGGIMIDIHFQDNIEHYSLDLENIDKVDFSLGFKDNTPSFYEYTFNIDKLGDTFIDLNGFGKGCVFINNFNLGRFWDIGPTTHIYIPAPLLKISENKIIIFETEGKYKDKILLKSSCI